MGAIDFNADLGESFGLWERGADDALMQVISSANVACGFHAGDPGAMRVAVEQWGEQDGRGDLRDMVEQALDLLDGGLDHSI